MTARSITRSIATPVARPVAGAGDGGAWTPDQLTNVLQRMDSFAYAASNIGGLPVVESSVGTAAVPRGQRCVLFDGQDDTASFAGTHGLSGDATFTLCGWVRASALNDFVGVTGVGNVQTAGAAAGLVLMANGSFGLATAGGRSAFSAAGVITTNTWFHLAVVKTPGALTGSFVKLYINGIETSVATTNANVPNIASTRMYCGSFDATTFLSGRIYDARIYNVAKSASEIQAIFNQASTPIAFDRTGLLAGWWLNEESGTTHYDWSGNGRNLTATNVTQATYHATDAGVRYNAANELGYTLSGSVVIPRNEATPAQDAAGGALQFSGPIKLNATMEVPCVTGDGSAAYIDLGIALIPATADFDISVWYFMQGTSPYTILDQRSAGGTNQLLIIANWNAVTDTASSTSWGVNVAGTGINASVNLSANAWNLIRLTRVGNVFNLFLNGASVASQAVAATFSIAQSTFIGRLRNSAVYHFSGRITDLRITTGGVTRYALFDQCGPGSSNTNRDFYIMGSDGSATLVTGGIVNGTVASIYANRTNVVRDWCLEYGGSIAANGAFVPGRIGSNLDAAGNAKGIASGTHGNPYSRFVPNFWSAPSLVNIGSTASDLYAPSGMAGVTSESTADTRYASGRRYLAVRSALTGVDKASAESWAAS